MTHDTLLMVADSERDANMLYAVRMFVPDPFIYILHNGCPHLLLSDLEIDRARKKARHCKVLSLTEYQQKLKDSGKKRPKAGDVIKIVLKELGVKRVHVPGDFPHGLARQLRDRKIKLKVLKGACFPEREIKNADEVKKISAALMMAEVGLAEGMQMLKRAKVGKKGLLLHNHVPLTSERLRAVIDTAIVQAGGLANHTIVAGGAQACDPHEHGSGPLRANEPIVLDVFPRSQKTGYFGDITRTVVKGRASEGVRKLYHTVARAQELAFKLIRSEVEGHLIHEAIVKHFEEAGYKSGKINGRMQGFFHGTGHGVGLDIHEAPRIGKSSSDVLRTGHVVTVEPGLYYQEVGDVRLEDMALVTNNGARNLTKFEKVLEL